MRVRDQDNCIIWFNGPSRNALLDLPHHFTEIGCNYILQDRRVDHVVAYDARVVNTVPATEGVQRWSTRSGGFTDWPRGWREVRMPTYRRPEQSGTLAVALADQLRFRRLWILGCDWGINTKTIYDYGCGRSARKHTNSQKRLMEHWAQRLDIHVVADRTRDVSVPHITQVQFREWYQDQLG